MKRFFLISMLLPSVLLCATAFAADITGEYTGKDGIIVIEKSNNASLMRVKFKNGHESEYVTDQDNSDWVEKKLIQKAGNAYYVKIRSTKGDCDYEGLTILKENELSVDDSLTYPIFSVRLENDGITPDIPGVTGGDLCLYMGLGGKFKKK